MVLVDTDGLVDCLRGTEAARQWLQRTSKELFGIPGVAAMELVVISGIDVQEPYSRQ